MDLAANGEMGCGASLSTNAVAADGEPPQKPLQVPERSVPPAPAPAAAFSSDNGVVGAAAKYAAPAEHKDAVEEPEGVRFTQTFEADYRLGDELGEGAFAVVRSAVRVVADPSGRIPERVAVKVIDKSKVEDLNDVKREMELLASLQHENIMRLFEVFDSPAAISLVLDLLEGETLFDAIIDSPSGHFTEKVASSFLSQLCSALSHVHARHIYHRDVRIHPLLHPCSALVTT